VMLLAAWGMWQRRYWAVLGFATLMALITVAFSLLLLIASNLIAVLICVAFAGSAGWLFWKLIRVMGRLQAPQRVSSRGPPPWVTPTNASCSDSDPAETV